jgi:hypothetical protein
VKNNNGILVFCYVFNSTGFDLGKMCITGLVV